MEFDSMISEIGFGKWQIRNCFVAFPILMWAGMNPLFQTFAGENTSLLRWFLKLFLLWLIILSSIGLSPSKFRCRIPQCDYSNSTVMQYGDIFPNKEDKGNEFCTTYGIIANSSVGHCYFNHCSSEKCTPTSENVIVESFDMENTITTEFGLFCDRL